MQQMRIMVDAARRLIAEKGTGFTTQELAKEAGVAIQTFYRHFGGKDQLLLAAIEDLIAENAARYEEEARELPDPVARLRYYVKAVLSGLDSEGHTQRSAPGSSPPSTGGCTSCSPRRSCAPTSRSSTWSRGSFRPPRTPACSIPRT